MPEVPFRRYDVRNAPEKLPKNVVVIDTAEARFRVAYGMHIREQRPEDVEHSDGIITEMIVRGEGTMANNESVFRQMRETRQYREVIQTAERKNIPMYLVDVPNAGFYASMLGMAIAGLEVKVAEKLVRSLYREFRSQSADQASAEDESAAEPDATAVAQSEPLVEIAEPSVQKTPEPLTRRDLLRRGLMFGAAAYIGTQAPEGASLASGGWLDESDPRRTVQRFLVELNETIHPETHFAIATFRNLLFAQKAACVARWLSAEKKHPDVALIVGAAHTGVEKDLVMDATERAETLLTILSVPGLEDFREEAAAIHRFDYSANQQRWQVTYTKDPALAAPVDFSKPPR